MEALFKSKSRLTALAMCFVIAVSGAALLSKSRSSAPQAQVLTTPGHLLPEYDEPVANLFSTGDLCRAAIATIMGRSVEIIQVDGEAVGVTNVSYYRPDDGTLWQQKCKFQGNQIIWAARDGRWRDNFEWDEYLTFSVDPVSQTVFITQKFPDGSGSTESFHKTQF